MFFLFIYLALLTFNGDHFELRREREEGDREREKGIMSPLTITTHVHKTITYVTVDQT
jgi:hypothetical protein